MGRRKRDLSYVKPFCYFCDKTFENEIVLHQHQKSKHFMCSICKKKFPTTLNLSSHIMKDHHTKLSKYSIPNLRIPNAIEGRDSPDNNIFGMTGVPKAIVQERTFLGGRFILKQQ